MRRTFMVGKSNSRGTEILVVKERVPPPIPGPWTLKALVRPASGRKHLSSTGSTGVH